MSIEIARFSRPEMLEKFRQEFYARRLNIVPSYDQATGRMVFHHVGVQLPVHVEYITPDTYGNPARFTIVDDAGTVISDGDVYQAVSALVNNFAITPMPIPDFEFVVNEPMEMGGTGKFSYEGRNYYVQFLNHVGPVGSIGPDGNTVDLGNIHYNDVAITDDDGNPVNGFNDLVNPQSQVQTVRPRLLANGRVLGLKLTKKAPKEEAKPTTAAVFQEAPLKRHLKVHEWDHRPYNWVLKVTRMTPAEVTARNKQLRTHKAHKVHGVRHNTTNRKMTVKVKQHTPNFTYSQD